MPTMIDPRTVAIVIVVMCVAMAGMLWIASLQAGTMRGARHWSAAQLSIGVGLGLNLAQQSLPAWLAIVLGNTLLFFGMGLTLCGIKLYKEEKPPWPLVLTGTLGTACLAAFFTFVDPSLQFRIAYISVAYALLAGWCARELLIAVSQPLRTAYWLTGGAFAVYAASALARGLSVAFFHPLDAPMAPVLVNTINICVGLLATTCATFGFVLMINYRMAVALENLASMDALTGALNRRSFRSSFARLSKTRQQTPLGLVMFDIDHFKTINDHFGHPVGDIVLQTLAQSARAILRERDLFIRMGGEEFCAVLDDTDEARAEALAARIRAACIASTPVVAGVAIQYTLSAGVASGSREQPITELIALADRALYEAKERGRNCIVRASSLEGKDHKKASASGAALWLRKTFIDLEETP